MNREMKTVRCMRRVYRRGESDQAASGINMVDAAEGLITLAECQVILTAFRGK